MPGKDYFHLLLIHRVSKPPVFRPMLVPSFIIIDSRKFEDLPDIDMPENACECYGDAKLIRAHQAILR